MKINIPLPFDHDNAEFWSMDAVQKVGETVDKAGFHAALVTDHPVPTGRWLDSGGHFAHGPLVMLSLLAAVTTRVRLQTGIMVLPYRNPFIVARDAATLDRYSNGRLTLSFGAGYLKGEYRALGVDFDKRNEIMDDYLKAMHLALTEQEFEYEGDGYIAYGNRIQPGPLQSPRPPFLIGGNAPRAIRRVVELADGWNPFFTAKPGQKAPGAVATTRTVAMEGEEDLIKGIDYMKAHCEKVGRKDMPEVILASVTSPGDEWSAQELIDMLSRYKELGVSGAAISVDGDSCAEWCDNAARIGEDVVAKMG